jgi:hypothetical protein
LRKIVWRDLLDFLEDLDAIEPRHAQVENGGIEDAGFQGLDRRLAIGTNGDFVSQARHLGSHDFLQRAFIVRKQDA